ncbi:MAG: NTP transferase domain-containing protein [Micropepsaceae bacterium]
MKKKPVIAAVVQARMRSTRLPGKVLQPVAGKPLLWHVLHRLKKSKLINALCVATTTDPADDELAAYAISQGATVVRGPEEDVLARYALAARTLNADIIVRVTADAPLVDAAFVDYLISEMVNAKADFVVLKPGLSAIHEGADPMTRHALDKLAAEAAGDPVAREHVSAYFKSHRDFVKVAEIDLPEKWRFKGARLSIDTPADVSFIETVYQRLHAQAGTATLTDLISLLNREPELLQLNANVQQKSATAASGTVVMRCDGGAMLGFGHVRRCLGVAGKLRDREGFGVRFAMIEDQAAVDFVRAAGFAVDVMPEDCKEIDWLLQLSELHKPRAFALDIRTALTPHSVLRLRGTDTLVVAIDDGSERRLMADATFYPPVPQVFKLGWELAEREPCVGWEWVALGHDDLPSRKLNRETPHVLVSMGGADPLGLTLPAVRALKAIRDKLKATVILGPSAHTGLEAEIRKCAPEFIVLRNPNNMSELMASADIGLVTFGVTAYELGAAGVPAIYLCLNEDHVESSSAFVNSGMGVSLGAASGVDEPGISEAVQQLLEDPELCRSMSAAGKMNLDSRGAQRIASRIAQLIVERAAALEGTSASRTVAA